MTALAQPLPVADLPFVDVTSPGFTWDDPQVAAAREECWAARTQLGVLTLRYTETAELLNDRRVQPDWRSTLLEPSGAEGGPLEDWFHWMESCSGEEHRRLRRPIPLLLSARRVAGLRPFVHATVQQLTEDLTGRLATGGGVCDFLTVFADRLPATVIHHVLGAADAGFDPTWVHELHQIGALGWDHGLLPRVEKASVKLSGYAGTLIAQGRARPGDGALSVLLRARQEGVLDEDELRVTVAGLLAAGTGTTSGQLGQAMVAFAQHPGQWRLLRERPGLVEQAVEEVLRFTPVVPVLAWKVAAEDITHHGVRIPTGTPLWIGLHAAHRDPRVFPQGGTFDITAEHTAPPLVFGGGPHTCPGMSLSRLELTEALTALTARFDPPQTTGPTSGHAPIGTSSLHTLPLRLGQASADSAPSTARR